MITKYYHKKWQSGKSGLNLVGGKTFERQSRQHVVLRSCVVNIILCDNVMITPENFSGRKQGAKDMCRVENEIIESAGACGLQALYN